MTYIVKKEIKGHKYYYEYESYRVGKEVKHRCVRYLGRSEDLGKRKTPVDIAVNSSLDYGPVIALHTLALRIGLPEIIRRCAPKGGGQDIGKLVEIMAINRCLDPVSRNRLKGWYELTALPVLLGIPPSKLHPQIFYNAMNYLTDEAILEIQREIYKNVRRMYGIDTSCIFYDLTSTYFEGTKCPFAEFGHSSDKRPDKLQINIGVAVDKDCIPITHEVFPGSVRDVSTLMESAQRLKSEFDIDSPIIIIDRGMISKKNLTKLRDLQYHYIIARKMGQLEKRVVQEIPDENYAEARLINSLEERELFLTERIVKDVRWIICWNREKAEDDRAFRDLMISKSIKELEHVKKGCGKRKLKSKEEIYHAVYSILEKHGTKGFFNIKINKRGAPRLNFDLNDSNIEKACKLDGKYIIETSDFSLKEIEVAQEYLDRDVVEKFFQMLKDVIGLRPTYVYTEQHVKAHVFICTLAVLLLSILRKVLKRAGKDMSAVRALDVLKSIKRVEFSIGGLTLVRTTEFSDQQREIVSIFNVAPLGL
jgi:Transposase